MTPLADQLRALPAFDPPTDAWPRLQRALSAAPARRRYRRLGAGLALAASVLVAVGVEQARRAPTAVAPGDAALQQLMQRSHALEDDLARLRPQVVVWDARYAAVAESIENRLAVVDLQLNYAEPDGAQRLWQDRVALMTRLVETHRAASLYTPPAVRRSELQEWSL
ncbi:MAG: hypothetical protein ACLGI7_18765 [Gammaproteobacteria bacterium]